MGRRLAALAENGLVVAVVGFSHLDGVENEFRDA
jgi:pheromone shutdown protein TraB